MALYMLKNRIQDYKWGSVDLMTGFFGIANDSKKPQAEMWMGAHPGASSMIDISGKTANLDIIIKKNPEHFLGRETSEKFSSRLPFLFKILAAGNPLSIQAHPDRQQAVLGFKRENSLGIPVDDPKRNYKDDNHKPEIICAVSEFHALRGFRNGKSIISDIGSINNDILNDIAGNLLQENGYRLFFKQLMTLNDNDRKSVLKDTAEWASAENNPVRGWVKKLLKIYPDDIAVLSPVYLNLVILNSGDAMFLEAGELHAYLSGIGIELMANSDNVLRGGLTVKNVDLDELDCILKYNECNPEILKSNSENDSCYYFDTKADEFRLSRINLEKKIEIEKACGPHIIICQDGFADIFQGDDSVFLSKGDSVFISPSDDSIIISGEGVFYAADIPS